MLNGISVIADGIGSRMDSLNTTLKLFTSTVFNEAPKNVPVTDTSSGVFRYDEEEAAVSEAASKLRRHGVELEEKTAVSADTDDTIPNVF
jgi:hypothetical protein